MLTTINDKEMIIPAVLRRMPLFANLNDEQLAGMRLIVQTLSIKAGTLIVTPGDEKRQMYFILSGAVKIETSGEDDNKLSQQDSFGAATLLADGASRGSAMAITDSELLVLDHDALLEIIRLLSAEETLEFFSILNRQAQEESIRESGNIAAHRNLDAQMEAEKQRSLTQMVAGVAHEINTPLGVINTAISIMAKELALPKDLTTQRAADIAESLELMRRNVERAYRLLLDFKTLSISQLADEKESLCISDVIAETIDLIMVNLRRSQVKVNFVSNLSTQDENWVGYRGVLSQVLINLLTNTERYAYPNGIGGTVDVTIGLRDEQTYILTVRDKGRGIPRENLMKVFEPFFTTGRSTGGTGLGLAIVNNLVTSTLKGEVRIKSESGQGAQFEIIFPRTLPD